MLKKENFTEEHIRDLQSASHRDPLLPVSYTHLDVYKRQLLLGGILTQQIGDLLV